MGKIPDVYRDVVGELVATIESPLMTRTVGEYFWGYRDPLLHELVKRLPELFWDDQVSLLGEVVSHCISERVISRTVVHLR